MRRYILTGTPGAGKTSILRGLARRGYRVVQEAATQVIADGQARGVPEPWTGPTFIDDIVVRQRERQLAAAGPPDGVWVFDRSPVCTHALAVYLGLPVTPTLARELDRIVTERPYQRQVFFVRSLGFVRPTAARRISLADALEFERVHEESYRAFDFELVDVAADLLDRRVSVVEAAITALNGAGG